MKKFLVMWLLMTHAHTRSPHPSSTSVFFSIILSVCMHSHPHIPLHYTSHKRLRCPLAPPPKPALSKGLWIFVFYAFSKTVSWWSILWSVLTGSWSEDHQSLDSASNDGSEYSGSGPKTTRKHWGLNRIQKFYHQLCSQTAGGPRWRKMTELCWFNKV